MTGISDFLEKNIYFTVCFVNMLPDSRPHVGWISGPILERLMEIQEKFAISSAADQEGGASPSGASPSSGRRRGYSFREPPSKDRVLLGIHMRQVTAQLH